MLHQKAAVQGHGAHVHRDPQPFVAKRYVGVIGGVWELDLLGLEVPLTVPLRETQTSDSH
jgi:hypothetical protein